jgi:hypothetical protein
VSAGRVTLTGATGLIGPQLIAALQARDYEITVLTRDPTRAREQLGEVEAIGWDLIGEAAPAEALVGREAVFHLAGEPVAQRWNASVKRAIRESRVQGTRNLIEGLRLTEQSQLGERPSVLISSSATGYYGPHREEPLDEDAPAGKDFLAHGHRARRLRRRPVKDASPLPARCRRAGRRRAPIHALDPR